MKEFLIIACHALFAINVVQSGIAYYKKDYAKAAYHEASACVFLVLANNM